MALDKELSFWVGNVVGLVALLVVIAIFAPQKARERQEYLDKQKNAANQAPGSVAGDTAITGFAVTAAKNIQKGATVKSDDLSLKSIPKDKATAPILTSIKQALGKSALHDINAGDPVLDTDLQSAGSP